MSAPSIPATVAVGQAHTASQPVQRAVNPAREQFPDSLPLDERRNGRNAFLQHHRWELFDADQDGYLSLAEYADMEWAGYLAQAAQGADRITRQEFLVRFLGDPDGALGGWRTPSQMTSITSLYNALDVQRRGYLVQSDFAGRTRLSFRHADANGDGRLSRTELP